VVADTGGYRTPFELDLPSWFIVSRGTLLGGTLLHGCGLHEAERDEAPIRGATHIVRLAGDQVSCAKGRRLLLPFRSP
jgi:hypothetical protein